MKLPEPKTLKKTGIVISIAVNAAMIIILFTPLTEWMYLPLTEDDKPVKSEVIVILAGDAYESGFPGFRTWVRLQKGMELYKKGVAGHIICSGGTQLDGNRTTVARSMKETLVFCGLPAGDVSVQDDTLHTHNDIGGLVKLFRQKFDFNKAVFVTSTYHTYRVKRILRKMKLDAPVVAAEAYEQTPVRWTERLGLFHEVTREYLAIGYSRLMGYL
ncbi:MAG: YdcF family protein [bacterium]|nr:YdcF family protein [bacterium]